MDRQCVTAAQYRFLTNEVQRWRERGWFPSEYCDAVLAQYEVAEKRSMRQLGLLTLSILGAVLLGLAVFLLIGYNWHELTGTAKISTIFAAMLAVYAVAGKEAQRGRTTISEVAFFFGAILFGVGIWQIAQVFHVSTYYPEGVWMWAIGTLLLALGTRSAATHLFAATLLAIWMIQEICLFSDIGPGLLRNTMPSFPNAAWTLPVLVCLGFHGAKIATASARTLGVVQYFYAMVLYSWLLLLPNAFLNTLSGWGSSFYYLFLGCGLFLVPQCLNRSTAANRLAQVLGVLTAGLALIPFSYEESWQSLGRYSGMSMEMGKLFLILCAIAEGGILIGLISSSLRRRSSLLWMQNQFLIGLGIYGLVGMTIACLVKDDVSFWISSEDTIWFALLQNILMFSFALSFLHRGLRQGYLPTFVLGTLYFLLWAILRYFDLFSDFAGMLGASGLFFFCAMTMFGMAWFWHFTQTKQQIQGGDHV